IPVMLNTLNVIQTIIMVLQVFAGDDGGEWTNWSNWSSCSVTCGYGSVIRERLWRFDSGEFSKYKYTHSIECWTEVTCPVHGGWSMWGPWTYCSEMCGGGTKERSRECNNPKPSKGGDSCAGEAKNQTECMDDPCPTIPPNFDVGQCDNSTFMCDSQLMCVPEKEKCDFEVQCHDGSDEKNCYQVDYYNGSSLVTVNLVIATLSAVLLAVLTNNEDR
ncbi:hypothetical protein ScPMuIL_018652, partial [Solemya velum]